jgi:hypothetical protein
MKRGEAQKDCKEAAEDRRVHTAAEDNRQMRRAHVKLEEISGRVRTVASLHTVGYRPWLMLKGPSGASPRIWRHAVERGIGVQRPAHESARFFPLRRSLPGKSKQIYKLLRMDIR